MTTISVTQQKITSGLNPFARGAIINGKRVERWLHEQLDRPLRWKNPRHIILTADLFGDWVTDEMLGEIFAAMALTPQHTYQVLTKRPDRMLDYMNDPETRMRIADKMISITCGPGKWDNNWRAWTGFLNDDEDRPNHVEVWPLPHIWLGVSVEDQKTADERIPLLLETPAAVRFLSLEPLLGPVDIQNYLYTRYHHGGTYHEYNQVDWVIVGGESGPNARPFDIAWARSIIRQCKDAGVPVFMKQLGAKPVNSLRKDVWGPTGKHHYTRPVNDPLLEEAANAPGYTITNQDLSRHIANKKGGDWSEWPDDVRIRELPNV